MKGNHYRAIFISDVHLGTHACQAHYLKDFLVQNTCDTLYLVGDIIDLLAMRKRVCFTASHQEVLSRIMKMARQGVRVVYIPGNHDAMLRRFCGQVIAGVEVRLNAVHETRTGERFFVSHGDEFDGIMQCSAWLNRVGDISHGLLLKLNTLFNWARRGLKLPFWSLARAVKKHISSAQAFILQFERIASRQAQAGDYDGYICGHIHHWQMRYYDQTLYVNDGDWVEHCTALVESPQGELQLLHWADHKSVVARQSDLKKPADLTAPDKSWGPLQDA
ncbi:MAG: UDP-2,3-diacylglucosamine diphosphatase [Ketobacteraceae bacterium]|nr:UDP-2,3-diacylglucosamine diphosphatase [Ketobacteraceae bacterium]